MERGHAPSWEGCLSGYQPKLVPVNYCGRKASPVLACLPLEASTSNDKVCCCHNYEVPGVVLVVRGLAPLVLKQNPLLQTVASHTGAGHFVSHLERKINELLSNRTNRLWELLN